MSTGKIKYWEKEERFGHAKYYKFNEETPVIILYDKNGEPYGALRPDSSPGTMRKDATLISRHTDRTEFQEISEVEFDKVLLTFTPKSCESSHIR